MLNGLTFYAGALAAAGGIAALAPIVIHLLNRRRYRVVQWAAMDFLREALSRSRRAIELRDILLMTLRALCLLLLGLALARPHFSARSTSADRGGPVHAVLVIDNSLSMAYERLDGTLLDAAKARAREVLDQLPQGSRTSVIPLCSSPGEFSWDAYRTSEDAQEALRMIEAVDRSGSASQAVDRAREACQAVTDLPAKRVIFISDQQTGNWPHGDKAAISTPEVGTQPLEMYVVAVAADQPENSWVAGLELRETVADTETDAAFIVHVRHEGIRTRPNVLVSLAIDGSEVGSRSVDLEPGQTREVAFTHRFDSPPESGQAAFAAVEATITPDRLPADDRRALVVPVVATLPVVFVDQYGDEESPQRNEYGETFRLRRLLAPVTARGESGRQLVQIRRARIDQLDREMLADARLVVVAGVDAPGTAVPLLREYVLQGGQLLIATGAGFNPAAWNDAAWLDGAGILPTPLGSDLVGRTPDETAGELRPFFLSFDSMSHDLFQLANVPRDELADLYQLPYFFKTAAANASDEVAEQLLAGDRQRLEQDRQFLAESDERRVRWSEAEAKGAMTDEQKAQRQADDRRREEIQPQWLRWAGGTLAATATQPVEENARLMRPRVLAAFTNKLPFLVERDLGQGRILFCSTAVQSDWNTLTKTNAVLLFDQWFRRALASTLPRRNLSSSEPVVLPIEPEDRRAAISVGRPNSDLEEPLLVEALENGQFGVYVRNASQRGIYRLAARRPETATSEAVEEKLWEVPLAVNGPEPESQLAALDREGWQERVADSSSFRWTAPGEAINLAGLQVRGEGLWRWLLAALLGCLLLEMALLAYSRQASTGNANGALPLRHARAASPEPAAPMPQEVET